MTFSQCFVFVQNFFLIFFVFCPVWILCKGKKKGAPPPPKKSTSPSNLPVNSAIKPAVTDPVPPSQATPAKEEKKEEPKLGSKEPEKKEEGNAGAGGGDKDKAASEKNFPKFVMPTESTKKKKEKVLQAEKNKKITEGFYQAKSDEDDTLEKIASLEVENSDKTKRSQKKKDK